MVHVLCVDLPQSPGEVTGPVNIWCALQLFWLWNYLQLLLVCKWCIYSYCHSHTISKHHFPCLPGPDLWVIG